MSAVVERRTWFGLGKPRIEERALTRANVPAVMLQSTVAGVTVTPATALQLVDVLAAVRLLAETASTLPLIAYRRSGDGRERTEGRPASLLKRPSPGNTQANLVAQLVGSLALRGNAFLGKYRNGDGVIEQLGMLPPDRIEVELKGGMPFYTLTSDRGRRTVHGPTDILHFKGLSVDGLVGLSPIGQAREALGLARALAEQASAMVANDATPLGVLAVPVGPGTEDLIENLRKGWEDRHRGARNAGRVAVLAGDIKFNAVSLSPVDSEFVAQRKLSTQEIARLFRVPAHLIGGEAGTSMTYSNLETEAAAFVKFSLAPWLTVIEQGISADDDLCGDGVWVEFLLDGLLRADSSTRATVYTAALDPITGWMSRDEVRRLENLPAEAA